MEDDNENDTTRATPDGITANLDPASALADYVAELVARGEPVSVSVWRVTSTGREQLDRVSGEEFDIFTLGHKYGPGRYFARARTGRHWGKAATFLVGAQAPRAVSPAAPVAAPAASGPDPALFYQTILGMMQAQADSSAKIVAALLTRPSDGVKVSDLLAMMEKRSGVGEILETMEALRRLQPSTDDRGEDDGLAPLLAGLTPFLTAAQQPPAAVPSTQPAALSAAKPMARDISPHFRAILAILNRSIEANETPTGCAEAILRRVKKDGGLRELAGAIRFPNAAILAALARYDRRFERGLLRSYAAQALSQLRQLLAKPQQPPAAPAAPVSAPVAKTFEDLDFEDDSEDLEDGDDSEEPQKAKS